MKASSMNPIFKDMLKVIQENKKTPEGVDKIIKYLVEFQSEHKLEIVALMNQLSENFDLGKQDDIFVFTLAGYFCTLLSTAVEELGKEKKDSNALKFSESLSSMAGYQILILESFLKEKFKN